MDDTVADVRLTDAPGVASMLDVSPRTVRTLADLGYLERVPILGAVRYRVSDVERLVLEGTRGPSRRVPT